MTTEKNESTPPHRPAAESAVLTDVEARMSDAEYAAHADKLLADAQAASRVAGRVCGECTACCTVLQVVELKKASNRALSL